MTIEEIRVALKIMHEQIEHAERCLNVDNRAGVMASMLVLVQHAQGLDALLIADRRREIEAGS